MVSCTAANVLFLGVLATAIDLREGTLLDQPVDLVIAEAHQISCRFPYSIQPVVLDVGSLILGEAHHEKWQFGADELRLELDIRRPVPGHGVRRAA